jgi:hypothetical protein
MRIEDASHAAHRARQSRSATDSSLAHFAPSPTTSIPARSPPAASFVRPLALSPLPRILTHSRRQVQSGSPSDRTRWGAVVLSLKCNVLETKYNQHVCSSPAPPPAKGSSIKAFNLAAQRLLVRQHSILMRILRSATCTRSECLRYVSPSARALSPTHLLHR